jgi:hypothetical protein
MPRALAMAGWAAMMLGLSGCTLEGLSSLDSEGYDSKEKRDWFDRFYGDGSSSDPNCSFWGNCDAPAAAPQAEAADNCSFWGNCDAPAAAPQAAPAEDCAFYGTCNTKKSSGWW